MNVFDIFISLRRMDDNFFNKYLILYDFLRMCVKKIKLLLRYLVSSLAKLHLDIILHRKTYLMNNARHVKKREHSIIK